MITDLDVIRACRDAQACITPPSSMECLRRRHGVPLGHAYEAMVRADERGLIEGHYDAARPTESGLRLLKHQGER